MKTAFLDSSVLFTAVNSPSGGSAKLFTIKKIKLITSVLVFTEVERNIRRKLQTHHLERFFLLASKLTILEQKPDEKLIEKAKRIIAKKDAVILAEGIHSKCNYIVSLDQKHFLTEAVQKFIKPQEVLTPKTLLKQLNVG